MSSARTIKVNRAPVLTLWAAVVAERLGFERTEALTRPSVGSGAMTAAPSWTISAAAYGPEAPVATADGAALCRPPTERAKADAPPCPRTPRRRR